MKKLRVAAQSFSNFTGCFQPVTKDEAPTKHRLSQRENCRFSEQRSCAWTPRNPTGSVNVFLQLKLAISKAHHNQLDNLAGLVWQGHGAGFLTDEEANQLDAGIQIRRRLPAPRRSIFPSRRPQKGRDRAASVTRRRRLAATGQLPPELAAHFTTSELAVMTVLVGATNWPIDRIAAVAGVSRTTVQNTLRKARGLGIIQIQERRRTGRPNLPNLVRIVCKKCLVWIRRRGGFKKESTTNTQDINPCNSRALEPYTPNGNLRLSTIYVDRALPRILRESPIWKRV